MRMVRIKDIGRVVSGSTPKSSKKEYWDGNIPWVSPKEISALESPYLKSTERKITEAGYKSSSTTLLPKNSVLFTSRAPIGQVAINSIEVCTNQGFKSIILNKIAYPLYIYYVLKANERQLNSLGTGTTFKELSKTTFENFEIPLPSLPDQVKIATVLENVGTLISNRGESLSLLDQLIKTAFWKSYQDQSKKEYTFDQLKEDGKGTFSNGPFGSNLLSSELTDSGLPVIYIRDVSNERFEWKSNVYISEEKGRELESSKVEAGDLLISKVGTPPGVAAIYPNSSEIAIVTQDVIRLRVNRKIVHPVFLQYLINSDYGKFLLRKIIVSGTRSRFALGQLKSLKIEIPEIEIQDKFINQVDKIDKLRIDMALNINELRNLYNSINLRALKGELDLSELNIEHIVSKSNGGSDDYENLLAIPRAINVKVSSSPEDHEKPKKRVKKEELEWNKISLNQLADWIRSEFGAYHFTSEMLIKYLTDEKEVIIQKGQPLYYSSEEIKKNLKLDVEKDLKKIIYDSLLGESTFLALEQIYYDGEKENFKLKIRENDYDFVYNKSKKERSGIYLKVKS